MSSFFRSRRFLYCVSVLVARLKFSSEPLVLFSHPIIRYFSACGIFAYDLADHIRPNIFLSLLPLPLLHRHESRRGKHRDAPRNQNHDTMILPILRGDQR